MKTRFIAIVYFLFIALVIYFADSRAHLHWFTFLRSVPGGDKLGHFLLMGTLAFLVNLSLSCRSVRILGRPVLLGSVLVLVLITMEEFSQRFVPYRTFDLVDLLADYLGIVVFSYLALAFQKKRRAAVESRG